MLYKKIEWWFTSLENIDENSQCSTSESNSTVHWEDYKSVPSGFISRKCNMNNSSNEIHEMKNRSTWPSQLVDKKASHNNKYP